jgi:hypothetical protein
MAQAIFEPTFSCINSPTFPKPSYSSHLPTYEDGTDSVPKRWHINFKRWGITQKKAYNICSLVSNTRSKERRNADKTPESMYQLVTENQTDL